MADIKSESPGRLEIGISAPASDVMAPPSNLATTSRPETTPNPHRSTLHSVRIGEFLQLAEDLCYKGIFAESEPRCTYPREKCGLSVGGSQKTCRVRRSRGSRMGHQPWRDPCRCVWLWRVGVFCLVMGSCVVSGFAVNRRETLWRGCRRVGRMGVMFGVDDEVGFLG